MAYCGQDRLLDYLNFGSSAAAPEKAIVCAFTEGGAGMPPTVLSLFVFGSIGLALTYRVRHPAPIMTAGMLTAGVAAINAPGPGLNILGIVLFVGISALALYLYQRARTTL